MTAKICVLGSVNLDLVVRTNSAQPGGKGANVALAARRLGADVTLHAAIGQDDFAQQALKHLSETGVDLSSLLIKTTAHTGLAFINVSETGENQIAVASGANSIFSAQDLQPIEADALITQFEIPLPTVLRAVTGFAGFTCLNASPTIPDLKPYLEHIDLLIVNETEAAYYGRALDQFTGLLAITYGAGGAILKQAQKTLAKSLPPVVDVMDTTGAGDCFAAALTLALVEHQPHQQALDFACIAGALATTKLGAQSASPRRTEVDQIV